MAFDGDCLSLRVRLESDIAGPYNANAACELVVPTGQLKDQVLQWLRGQTSVTALVAQGSVESSTRQGVCSAQEENYGRGQKKCNKSV